MAKLKLILSKANDESQVQSNIDDMLEEISLLILAP